MDNEFQIELQRILSEAMDIIIEEGREELDEQGHKASGRLSRSFEKRAYLRAAKGIGEVLMNDYGIDLDTGKRPEEIPAYGTAEYTRLFRDLVEWSAYAKPNLAREERLTFAFLVASKMRREGTPTKGSYKFSRNGRRTGWMKETVDNAEDRIARLIENSTLVSHFLERQLATP